MLLTLAGGAALAVASVAARPDVYTYYPYTGPDVPVGDWVDNTVNGNGKGFPRLVVPPAVAPNSSHPTNNINVITLAYIPNGMNIHFQTPFGIGASPYVKYGTSAKDLKKTATGATNTFGRTPSCSAYSSVTQCSEYFHNVQIQNLTANTVYYYQIPGGNGTTASPVMHFKTAPEAGADSGEFSLLVVNDMGFTNAGGTHTQMSKHAKDEDTLFVWHGGDISYADDWYSGVLPCDLTGPDAWPVCYNGTSTSLPGGNVPAEYDVPLPAGETPNQGGPQGGDYSVIYESNWDLWQNWLNNVTEVIPYMTTPGNHEAACAEFDGGNGTLSAYLNKDQANSTDPTGELTYFSCPPSQRNFTGYQHRFRMPGNETGGKGNFWYSFDVGLAHFISFTSETDYYQSPSSPFVADLSGNETLPMYNETYITDAGPFGYINGSYKVNQNYEQYQWLKKDLESVNRTKTPWVFAMSHRPMYSSQVSKYQTHMRNAFEELFIENNVDGYFAGHIHWYERMLPLNNGTIIEENVVNNNTYLANSKGLIHVTNGQAGNIESHSELDGDPRLNITAFLDATYYGNSKLTVFNSTMARWQFIHGLDGAIGDELYIVKSK